MRMVGFETQPEKRRLRARFRFAACHMDADPPLRIDREIPEGDGVVDSRRGADFRRNDSFNPVSGVGERIAGPIEYVPAGLGALVKNVVERAA